MGFDGIEWCLSGILLGFTRIYTVGIWWDITIGGLNQPQVAWFHSWTSTLKLLDNYGINHGKLKDLVDHELPSGKLT